MTVLRNGKCRIGEQMCILITTWKRDSLDVCKDGYQNDSWQHSVRFYYSALDQIQSLGPQETFSFMDSTLQIISETIMLSY